MLQVAIVSSLLAVGAAAPALATQVSVQDPVTEGRGSAGSITVTGDPGDNHIVVHWSRERRALIVEDSRRVRSERCDRLGAKQVSCPFAYEDVWIYGDKGRDTIVIRKRTTRFETIFAYGGRGRDGLLGGDGDDYLSGDLGDDRLDGRGGLDSLDGDPLVLGGGLPAGDDVLRGGSGTDFLTEYRDRGADAMFGEGGNDYLNASDGSRDRVLDGGPGGSDYCEADRIDPAPVHCERR